ncbi:MAG: alpha/beta hydrolase fold protein, partial [Halothiobacillaceae bacterium]
MMPTHHTLRAVLLLGTSLFWSQLVWCNAKPDREKEPSPHTWFATNPIFEGRVYLEEWGDPAKPAILLVHGLGNNGAKDWRHLAPLLSTAFHVITFDLPGFGRSSKVDALYSPDNYARFVDWVAASYAKKPFILVGHSMGGVIALTYATQHPDKLKQLILINVAGVLHRAAFSKYLVNKYKSYWWSHLIPDTEQLDRQFGVGIGEIDRFDTAFNLILTNSFTRQIALGGDPAKIAGLAMVQKDFSGLLEQVTPPTTIIWGA